MRPRLLIVEDDPAMTEVWQVVFSQRGWDVTVAATVAAGLASLDPAPDYLILDLRLPDGDGEAILRQIRETGLRTRVAVTTAMEDAERLGAVRGLGPETLLSKPVDVAEVWQGTTG